MERVAGLTAPLVVAQSHVPWMGGWVASASLCGLLIISHSFCVVLLVSGLGCMRRWFVHAHSAQIDGN